MRKRNPGFQRLLSFTDCPVEVLFYNSEITCDASTIQLQMSLQTQLDIRNSAHKLKESLSDLSGWLKEAKATPPKIDKSDDMINLALECKLRGNSFVSQNDFKRAIDEYSDGITRLSHSPDNRDLLAQLYLNRALCNFKLQQYKHALRDANESLNQKTSIKALFRKGNAELKLKQFDAATESIGKCIALCSPDDHVSRKDCEALLGEIRRNVESDRAARLDEARKRLCNEIPDWCKNLERAPLRDLPITGLSISDPTPCVNHSLPVKLISERYIPRSERMFGKK